MMKKVISMILAVIMVFVVSIPVFAAEVESQEQGLTPQETLPEGIELPENAVVLSSATYYYLINTAGQSTTTVTIPWSTISVCPWNATLIMYLRYSDNHTGYVRVSCAQYTHYEYVNGTSRVVDTNMYFDPDNYTLKIIGVNGTLTYSVLLYVTC